LRASSKTTVEVAVALDESFEKARGLHLRAVILREPAVVLVAEDDVVRAHALLGAEPHGAERLAVDGRERLHVYVLLRRLGRQDEEPPVRLQSAHEQGEKRGRGFPDAGRGLDEQVLALRGGAGDRRGHLTLSGPEARVREDERRGFGGFRFGEGPLIEERVEKGARPPDQVLERLLGLVGHVEELRRACLDVGEDETPAHGPAFGRRDRLHVPAQLELKALEARGARELSEVLGEMQGLDLIHHDVTVLFETAVEAPLEDRGEVVHRV
jgi:hypothetical protein